MSEYSFAVERGRRRLSLSGIEFVEGDFTKQDTFARALAGIDRLFLLIPSSSEVEQQQRNFVDAAKRSGVKHIVKLSQLGADAQSTGRFQRYHGAVEDYIRNSGIEHTFLRPNLFMQGLLGNFRAAISGTRSLFILLLVMQRSASSMSDDIAAIAALALTETGHEEDLPRLPVPNP